MEELEPLPVLTSAQWYALPVSERARLRALKRKHQAANLARGSQVERLPLPSLQPAAIDPNRSPFRTHDNRSIHLGNLGNGGQCFVVLSGPSLKTLDLRKLNRRGVFTIGVNNAPTVFRTNAWVYVDRPNKFHESIWLDPAVLKFVHYRHLNADVMLRSKNVQTGEFSVLKWWKNGEHVPVTTGSAPGVIGIQRNAYFEPTRWLSEPEINWGNSEKSSRRNRNPRCLNVMFAVTKLAYALGFRTVYLLGCDFSMSQEQPYAFAQTKNIGGVAGNNNSYSTMNKMFDLLRPHFDAAGYRIFNCNPNSGLRTFPHLSFDDAIAAATSHIPQDPLDASGWYE